MKIQIIHVQSQEVLVTIEAKNRGTSVLFTEGQMMISQSAFASGQPIPNITVGFDIAVHSINIGS